MKLAEAVGVAQLRDDGLQRQPISKEIKPALELARDIFAEAEDREQPFLYHTPESWVRRWLPSKRFRLMRLALNACAMPCEPKVDNLVLKKIHAMETKPIVVDYNKNQIGKSFNGFVPQIIVIDGKHRFKAASLRGETHIMAWVGEIAMKEMHAVGGGGPAPESTTPAPGARLNAKGSMQDARLQTRQGTTYAEGKKLKTLNVEDVEGGGPGSGRHKEFGAMKDVVNNAKGYVNSRIHSNGMTYKHPDGHVLTIRQFGNGAQWEHRAAGSKKYERGNSAESLQDHLEFVHGGPVSKPGEMGDKLWKRGSVL